MPYRDPTPIDMHVQGERIYCHNLTEEQQKWMIDAIGSEVTIVMDKKPLRVRVKGVKKNKAILEVR